MKKKVLIVDDNDANLYLLKSLLEGEGFAVVAAKNGQEALEMAEADPPDMMVSDILMPVMDGYLLCRKCKADERLREIPFVFYTATYTEPKDEAFALSLGADRFVLKPQEPETLLEILTGLWKERSPADRAEPKPLGAEMDFFRQYNEVLFRKLEKKMLDLEVAHRKLKCLEEQYRLSFENVTDIVWTINCDFQILKMSPSVEKLLGYKPGELIGRSVVDLAKLFTPDAAERAMAEINSVLKGETTIPASVYALVAKDGTVKYGEISGSPILRNGAIIGMVSVIRDITERRRIDEAIRQSEKKYRELFDFLPIPLFEMDFEANITSANRATYETFRATEDDFKKGFQGWQLLSSEDMDKSAQNIQRLLKGEQIEATEYTLKRLDGSSFPALVVSRIIYSNDKPVGIRGAIVDITERKHAEKETRTVAEVGRIIGSSLEIGEVYERFADEVRKLIPFDRLRVNLIHAQSGTLRLVYMSGTAVATREEGDSGPMMGSLTEELIRTRTGFVVKETSLEDLIKRYPAAVSGYKAGIRSLLTVPLISHGEVIGSLGFRSKTPNAYAERDLPIAQRIGDQIAGAIANAQLFAQLKRTEVKLREDEERFRAIFEHSPVGKSLATPDGKIIQANKAFVDMLGYTIGEIEQIKFKQIIHPDDLAAARECVRILRAGEQKSCRFETRFIHKNGAIVWGAVSCTLLCDDQGSPLYFITAVANITDRKRADEALLNTMDRLRRSLAGTVQAIAMAVEVKDPYTSGHQKRASDLARAIATEMGLTDDRTDFVRTAASIHDIGKIAIPAEILSKPTKLSEIEFSLIKVHPQAGYNILKGIEFPWPLAEVVLQHHERMDGSGYPEGLKGEAILLEARIMAVADVVEAMASHRPYRPALGIEAALAEIEANKETLYDASVVEACLKLFRMGGYRLQT
jgi:PAS domain S-box-containing protein